ncbi:unnamed protein product [Symbiodinium sp. CCMP2456]|nr:unnamed protein product [Symbiodinium sp. CCMP2456]
MPRFCLVALVALGATQYLVHGARPNSHAALPALPALPWEAWQSYLFPSTPWREHPASPAEELQKSLSARLAGAEGQEIAEKAVDEAQKQEQKLRELVANITGSSQSASANLCYGQLGGAMASLTQACEGAKPEADWLLDYYDTILPKKTCNESVADIFAAGRALVETLHVSRHAVAALKLDNRTLRRYQALSFLRSWLVNLTRTSHPAMLWTGFWDGDPNNRTTKEKLSEFAHETDHAIVHPDSFLGRVVEEGQDLDACYVDDLTKSLASNMWAVVSMSFVLGMREKGQGTVVSLVNKDLTGERRLSKSVLFVHEMPTVGLAAWGLGFWSPKVVLVDLMGTCDQTSPALQMQLFARLPTWAKSMPHWSRGAFALRSRLQWQCIDCSGACSLDKALAEHVDTLVKAKEERDRKDQELRKAGIEGHDRSRQAVDLKRAIFADAGQSNEELSLGRELAAILRRNGDARSAEVEEHVEALWMKLHNQLMKLHDQSTTLLRGFQDLDGATKLQRVEQLLHQKADPSAPDRMGLTALMSAAREGLRGVVEACVKAGAQLDARDELGRTALIHAAENRHLHVVKALLQARAQPDIRDEKGNTALTRAAAGGYLEMVEVLLVAGAQLEAHTERGWTALIAAAIHQHLEVVEALLSAGAQLEARDEEGNTALIWAARRNCQEVVEALLKAGARPEARDKHNRTAFDCAQENKNREIADILKKHFAEQ